MYTLTKREAADIAAELGVRGHLEPPLDWLCTNAARWDDRPGYDSRHFALQTRQVPCGGTLAQARPGLRGRVAAYHGDLTVQARRDVHAAFMHDRLTVGGQGLA